MNDRVRTALAFGIIIAILLVWTFMSRKPPAEKPTPTATGDSVETTPPEPPPDTWQLPSGADTFVYETAEIRIVLSSAGGSIKELYIKEHDVNVVPDDGLLFVSLSDNGKDILSFDAKATPDSIRFSSSLEGLPIVKTYHFNEDYGFHLVITAPDELKYTLSLRSGLRITEARNAGEDLRHFDVHLKDTKVYSIKKKIKDEFSHKERIEWFSLRSKYFMLAINNNAQLGILHFYNLGKDDTTNKNALQSAEKEVYAAVFGCYFLGRGGNRYGAEINTQGFLDLTVRILPIKYSFLAQYKEGYEQITSGGLFGPISRLFLIIFNFLYSILRNYGLVIILFAIIIKAIFFPLSRQMIRSQHKMQMLQPELKKLQQKYKDDPQRVNQEMMHLYKTYKVNPFSGCLPLIIQMPIFFALYQTLITSIEFRNAPFIFWIADLSYRDPYYVLPITMGVMMLVQSLITTVDPRQRFMVIIMPIFMVFIFLNFPSGLQLYWFSYNILTLVEHIVTKRGGIK